jgi:hypothetical protein
LLRSHAGAVVVCDFFAGVTAAFRLLQVFVVIELGSRRAVSAGSVLECGAQGRRRFDSETG